MFYASGDRYAGQFRGGRKEGLGVFFYTGNEARYEG
jgi:hypothetical protein